MGLIESKKELREFLNNLQQKHKLTHTHMYHIVEDEYARYGVKMCKEDGL